MKYILLVFAFLITACSQEVPSTQLTEHQKSSAIPTNFKIISDDKRRNIKRSVEVLLDDRIEAHELERLAMSIHTADFDDYERTFISYRLKGSTSPTYWATTHFTPELKIEIQGVSADLKASLLEKLKVFESYEFAWFHEYGYPHLLVLRIDNDQYTFHEIYSNGETNTNSPNFEKLHSGIIRFSDPENDFGEHTLLMPDGELKFIGESGNNYYSIRSLSI